MSEPSKATPGDDDSQNDTTDKSTETPAANDAGAPPEATNSDETADKTIPLEPVAEGELEETKDVVDAQDAANDAGAAAEEVITPAVETPKKNKKKFSVRGMLVSAFKRAVGSYINVVAAIGRKSKLAAVAAALVIPAIPAYLTMGAAGHFAEATLGTVARSTGAQNGQIEKFSRQGLFVPTYEGELATSNFSTRGQGHANNNTFEFSVDRDAVDENGVPITDLIEQYQEDGVRVQLEYKQRLFKMALPFPGLTERKTNYEVVGVQPLGNQNAPDIPKVPNP